MTSKTTKVKRIRARKSKKQGADRKNQLRKLGSTAPNLALDKPNANETALKKRK